MSVWTERLLEQLTVHWELQLRPKLDGLTDDEYLWEPVPGCWSIRPRAEATAATYAGAGEWGIEFEVPEPDPPPVTTIAWRLGHLIVGVFGQRNASHFGGPPISYPTYEWSPTAAGALADLDEVYAAWVAGASALGEDELERPLGPAEGPYAEHPYAALLLHINRETIHHGAEILLLRDLYRSRAG